MEYLVVLLMTVFIATSLQSKGSWKQKAEGKPVHYNSSSSTVVIRCKKKMRYIINNEHKEDDGHYWLMQEYELSNVILHKFDEKRRDYVLCAITKKLIETCSSEIYNVSEETNDVNSSNDNSMCWKLEQSKSEF
ncbi:hypothetical protein CQW23_16527 [Capsicum baccatum]|uniref:NAC domain-containing protein n=1 Tax=Capsicum baccatum TaxID=33114 RepID=A0A2G2WBC7_CAPBA|nr:hypothetical protein CQW23_16527 [Capsicum baccatum]